MVELLTSPQTQRLLAYVIMTSDFPCPPGESSSKVVKVLKGGCAISEVKG